MRIEQLEYRDLETGWHLKPATFHPDLTLLVGVSGVGKTRILRAIQSLRAVALHSLAPSSPYPDGGVAWRITFITSGKTYVWEAELEKRSPSDPDQDGFAAAKSPRQRSSGPRFIRERLLDGDCVVIDRDRDGMRFRGAMLPKLSPYVSALNLLGEEESVDPAVAGLKRIAVMDNRESHHRFMVEYQLGELRERYRTLSALREADLPVNWKLGLVRDVDEGAFRDIVRRYVEIFPYVEDVRVKRLTLPSPKIDYPFLEVKEAGSTGWILEHHLSSGMLRTLLHVALVTLSSSESVVLIDEVENSLGVNCLDEVTQDMLSHGRRIQFIVTSHHPYIINHIPPKNWKIVTRTGGEVKTLDAEAAGIGGSKHQAFLQLINSPAYMNAGSPP